MAKKTVASLQTTKKAYAKVITVVKNKKGAYSFKERIARIEDLEEEGFFENKE